MQHVDSLPPPTAPRKDRKDPLDAAVCCLLLAQLAGPMSVGEDRFRAVSALGDRRRFLVAGGLPHQRRRRRHQHNCSFAESPGPTTAAVQGEKHHRTRETMTARAAPTTPPPISRVGGSDRVGNVNTDGTIITPGSAEPSTRKVITSCCMSLESSSSLNSSSTSTAVAGVWARPDGSASFNDLVPPMPPPYGVVDAPPPLLAAAATTAGVAVDAPCSDDGAALLLDGRKRAAAAAAARRKRRRLLRDRLQAKSKVRSSCALRSTTLPDEAGSKRSIIPRR